MAAVSKLYLWMAMLALCALQALGQDHALTKPLDDRSVAVDATRIDTIRNKPDSVISTINSRLDSLSFRVNSKIDSLSALNLSPAQYTKSVDSLYRSLSSAIEALKDKYNEDEAQRKLTKADSLIAGKTQFMDSLLAANNFERIGEMSSRLKLPDHLSAHTSQVLPAIPGVSVSSTNLSIPGGSVQNPIPKVEGMSELNKASGIVKQAEQHGGQAGELSKEAKELNTPEVADKLAGEAEQRISKIDEVESINKASQAATTVLQDQTGAMKDAAKNPAALKEQANAKIADYLIGKEEIVKKDLEDIGKTQLKYRNIADSRFLPKRPPNEMKGKPIIERLIPGISFQVLNSDNILVDVAPFIGYRFSGKVSATVSGYHRLVYVKRDDVLRAVDCYGFRAYSNIKVFGSISTHVEIERYRADETYQYTKRVMNADHSWKNKMNFGAFNRYSLGRNFYGHFIIMYDLLQIKKFPNTTGAAARFGFDYQLRNGKKKPRG